MKATKTWVFIILLFIPAINLHAWPIPDTGQTKCYNNTAEITPCPVPGEAFYGQDGNYTINPPSYTKLDATGAVLPEDASSWAMVRDNMTGLIWENKTSDGSIHDGSKTFTWCDKNSATNGGNQGTCGTGTGDGATDTEAFIKALNDTKFGGFSDWRLPTAKELVSILDMGRGDPAVNSAWFPGTVSSFYWSSSTYLGNSVAAFCVIFDRGSVGMQYKTNADAVRAVRGGQVGSSYIDNGDGTAIDTKTGLMWQRETVSSKNWQAALDYTETLSLAGYDDWRLPNITELQSLVDYSRHDPAINTSVFPGTVSSYYWSSSTYAYTNLAAWGVDFSPGYVYGITKTDVYAVRAVRGGQSRLSGSLVISAPAQAAWWEIGTQQTILWDTASIDGNVKIILSRQGGKTGTFTEVIVESTPNNGSYTWTVTGPISLLNCALRIEPVSDASKGTTQSLFTIYGRYDLTVVKSGSGTGLMTVSTGVLSWTGGTGKATYENKETVTLSASGDVHAAFTGWSGACRGMGVCKVTMDQARDVTATFADLSSSDVAQGRPLPDTGQTKCYNNSGEITCPGPGEAFYGQDGNYSINPPSYTKLDAAGAALADDATSWAIIRDNVTGLIWENKTNEGTIHDGSRTFTWCDKNTATNGGTQGNCGTETGDMAKDTEAFIKALNDARFGGFSDWRLPKLKELMTILDRNRVSPAINISWFPNTSLTPNYWSSTTNASGDAWYIAFSYGSVTSNPGRAGAYAIRAVRGEQIENRYIDNGDRTATDTKTGLMWQQETVSGKTWQAAMDYAETLSLAGYDGWRLPNIDELQSLVDYSRYNPAIDTTAFPGTLSSHYWSSSTYDNVNDSAWGVDFNGGNVGNTTGSKILAFAVRAVRGGQSRSSDSLVISAPAQAARWEIGTQQTILWDMASIAGNVKISLSRQGGKAGTFTEIIAENVANNGSYNWTVTGPESFNCALRIEPLSDATKGTTQSLFMISSLQNAWISAEKQGDTGHYKLSLNGQYNDGVIPINAAFTTSDATVATVNQYGLLTALKNGYIEISTTYQGQTYKKGLFVYTALDAGESEGNNTKDVADIMMAASTTDPTISKFYKGQLTTGDTDWFKFTLSQGNIVNVGYLSQSTTADIRMDLYNSTDTLLASDLSANGSPLILPVGLPAGDYYLKLSIAGDVDQTGSYIIAYKTRGTLPFKTAIPIALSETKTGTIDTLADKQELTFTLTTEQAVQILFTPYSPTAKYRLTLLNGSQTAIDRVDCLYQKPVSLQAVYGAGNYTLQVTALDTVDTQNPFTVSLATLTDQLEKEPNDTAAQATIFDIIRSITGRLSSETDMDFFTFQLDAPRFLELGFTATGGTGNYSLTLFKESDQYEIDGIDITNGQTTSLHMGLGAGRYYLRVKGGATNIDTIHNYTLTFKDSSQTDLEIESNNTLKVANAIDKTQAKRGRIYSSQDKDYYGFNLPEGGFISLTFTPTTTTGDYKISLVDDNYEKTATPLYTYTSTNGETVSAADLYLEIPGNYYIRVEPKGDISVCADCDIDQYKPYSISLNSNVTIVGLKQLVNVVVTGTTEVLTISDTQTLTAKAGYSDATIASVTPTWTSLNPSVATVNGAGLVTAIAQGTTSIVASYGGLSGKFDLTVGAPQNIVKQHYGNLILVAGGGIADTNTLKESTQYLSDLVYRRFKARLFEDEDIYYFNPLPWHDINGDGYGESIVDDASPTVAKFGTVITSWAANQSTDGPLYLYLIDHGGIDNFMIFPNDIITAEQLKQYLDAFQTTTGRKVIVIIEACKSGSFTDNLIATGQDRVVVTSTNDQDSYIQLGGRISFSQFFVDRLLTGDSLNQAYLKAKQQLANMGLPYSSMQPKLVEGVNLSSNTTRLGGDFAIASLFPDIAETSLSMNITANTTQGFYANLSSLEGIDAVWAVVVPPDYVPPSTTGDLSAPQVTLPTFDLTDPEKDKRYEGSYSDFIYNGDYRITFYARNTNGNVSVSPSIAVTVTGGQNTSNTLTVTKSGTGDGTVTSDPAGINCGTDCTETYSTATALTLTAAPDNNSDFAGWSGTGIACTGTGRCTVLVDGAKLVNADFTRKLLKGDMNNDGVVTLADAILALKAIGGLNPAGIRADYATSGADVNGDGKIGLAEVIYILQKAAELR